MCTCVAECLLIVPNVATELYLAEDGPLVAICRIFLFFGRISFVFAPLLSRMLRRCDTSLRRRIGSLVVFVCGNACGSVEPSRGVATALAGWYLISTPMHDAFGGKNMDGPDARDDKTAAEDHGALLVRCVILMLANVCLFLCDALLLTVAPLLRQDVERSRVPSVKAEYAEILTHDPLGEDTRTDKASTDSGLTCVICLDYLEAGEQVAKLPCRHLFHADCVTGWLANHGSCPMRCPGVVLPPPGSVHQAVDVWAVRALRSLGTDGVGEVVEDAASTDSEAHSSGSLATERLEQDFSEAILLPSAVPLPELTFESLSDGVREHLLDTLEEAQRPQGRESRRWQMAQRWAEERSRPDS